jgi:hypothetical protein
MSFGSTSFNVQKRLTCVLQSILRFSSGVCIVEDNQNCTNPHASEEYRSILDTVASEDGYTVTRLNTTIKQISSKIDAVLLQIMVFPPRAIPWGDNRLIIAEMKTLVVQEVGQCQI